MTGGKPDNRSRLVDSVMRGDVLDLADQGSVDEAAMRAWSDDRTIDAAVIREILLGRLACPADPHGVRVRGARIRGRLDLENAVIALWLELSDCYLPEGLVLRDATLPGLTLDSCLVEHPSESPLDAARLRAPGGLAAWNSVIRAAAASSAVIVTGARIGGLDCTGARIHNSSGPVLDADDVQVDQAVVLGSGFDASGKAEEGLVRFIGAHIGLLHCTGGTLRNELGPALSADGLRVDGDVVLGNEFEATGDGQAGAVRLLGAHIGGQLNCSGGTFRNKSGPALYADGLQVDQEVFIGADFAATGGGERGAVSLRGARLRALECDGATIRNGSGPALTADGLRVEADVNLGSGFVATGGGEEAAVSLVRTQVAGTLNCAGGSIANEAGPALHADGLNVDQDVFLGPDFSATGNGNLAAVSLRGGRLRELDCAGGVLRNESGQAMNADGLHVEGDINLTGGFSATGGGGDPAVSLIRTQAGGTLNCAGGRFVNRSGPALNADSLRADRAVFIRDGFEAIGSGNEPAVTFTGAHIGIQLDCSGGKIRNDSGPALNADSLRVGQSVHLRDGFEAIGAGNDVTVAMVGAHVGNQLDCSQGRISNLSGPAVTLAGSRVEQDLLLGEGFEADGAGEFVVLNMTNLAIGGSLVFEPRRLEHVSDPHARLALDGLTYAGLPVGPNLDQWLDVLRDATPTYTPQPYQQVAAACRAAGHDADMRKALMAQRRDQMRRRDLTSRGERTWARLTGLTLGYGYQPWRALILLLAVVLVAVVLSLTAGNRGALAHPPDSATPGAPCSTVERIGVGLDLSLPLIRTEAGAQCDVTDTRNGQLMAVAGWTLQLLGWAFATLFIAGFTGVVRKT